MNAIDPETNESPYTMLTDTKYVIAQRFVAARRENTTSSMTWLSSMVRNHSTVYVDVTVSIPDMNALESKTVSNTSLI